MSMQYFMKVLFYLCVYMLCYCVKCTSYFGSRYKKFESHSKYFIKYQLLQKQAQTQATYPVKFSLNYHIQPVIFNKDLITLSPQMHFLHEFIFELTDTSRYQEYILHRFQGTTQPLWKLKNTICAENFSCFFFSDEF